MLAAIVSCSANATGQDYSITDLGVQTHAANVGALNNAGHAAGYAHVAPFTGPFMWNNGTLTQLPTQNTTWEQPYQINANDMMAGWAGTTGADRGVIWQDGNITVVPTFGGLSSYCYGLNDSGVVVGRADAREYGSNMFRPFRWYQGNMVQLPLIVNGLYGVAMAVNSAGDIVGWSQNHFGAHRVVRWTNNAITNLGVPSGFNEAEAVDVNDAGQILVTDYDNSTRRRAAIWDNGSFTEITPPQGQTLIGFRINNLGQVALGLRDIGNGSGESAIFTPGQGYFYPVTLFNNNPDWMDYFNTVDINDNGQILGLAIRRSDQKYRYVLLTPVPEPGSAVVFVAFSALLVWRRRVDLKLQ
jgi:probable HAF family extracellular repeat protein